MRKLKKLPFLLFFMGMTLFSVKAADTRETKTLETAVLDNVEGRWKYNVQNVDPQYQEGVMYISKELDNFAVKIMISGGMMPTEEVKVNDNEVSFIVYVEDDRVEIKLVIDGDTFAGTGTSSQGPFTLTGTRMSDPE
ncbi:MAG: hypothetical protein MUO53_01320 [Maribacter sp.]|nr:hypothetical protein [Maribacter sp.]